MIFHLVSRAPSMEKKKKPAVAESKPTKDTQKLFTYCKTRNIRLTSEMGQTQSLNFAGLLLVT